MPKSKEEKRLDAIRRQIKHLNGNYRHGSTTTIMTLRDTFSKLSDAGKTIIDKEFNLSGSNFQLWIK